MPRTNQGTITRGTRSAPSRGRLVIRRQLANGALTPAQANNAIEDLLNLPITVYPTAPLLRRAWELRENATAYDACYVAVAEALGCALVTADQRLANARIPLSIRHRVSV